MPIVEKAEGEEKNIDNAAHERLLYHYRLGHGSFTTLQTLAGAGILPTRLATCRIPQCTAYHYGMASKVPWPVKGDPKDGKLFEATMAGQIVSVDQLQSTVPELVDQMKGWLTVQRHNYATVFVDHYSRLSYVYVQKTDYATETLMAKQAIEAYARTNYYSQLLPPDQPPVVSFPHREDCMPIVEKAEGEENNIDNPAHELLQHHHRFGHELFAHTEAMAKAGILPTRLANCHIPQCAACHYGKASKVPWRVKGNPKDGKLFEATVAGQVVSVLADHFSRLSFAYAPKSDNACIMGVEVQHYNADYGRFCETRELQDGARTSLIHTNHRWGSAIESNWQNLCGFGENVKGDVPVAAPLVAPVRHERTAHEAAGVQGPAPPLKTPTPAATVLSPIDTVNDDHDAQTPSGAVDPTDLSIIPDPDDDRGITDGDQPDSVGPVGTTVDDTPIAGTRCSGKACSITQRYIKAMVQRDAGILALVAPHETIDTLPLSYQKVKEQGAERFETAVTRPTDNLQRTPSIGQQRVTELNCRSSKTPRRPRGNRMDGNLSKANGAANRNGRRANDSTDQTMRLLDQQRAAMTITNITNWISVWQAHAAVVVLSRLESTIPNFFGCTRHVHTAIVNHLFHDYTRKAENNSATSMQIQPAVRTVMAKGYARVQDIISVIAPTSEGAVDTHATFERKLHQDTGGKRLLMKPNPSK
jgi:hypothetical protein